MKSRPTCSCVGAWPLAATTFGPLRCERPGSHAVDTDLGQRPVCFEHSREASSLKTVSLADAPFSPTRVKSVRKMSAEDRDLFLAAEVMSE